MHQIDLIVVDEHQCADTTDFSIIANPSPQAAFAASDSFGCSPFLTIFRDLSDGSPTKWNWNFGDGGSSSIQQPMYTYLQDGLFNVSLKVENIYGCADSTDKLNYINLKHPVADFTVDQEGLCPNEPLNFINLSRSDTLFSGFKWNFGDGNSSQESDPTHIYTTSGFYDVSLIVIDTFLCKDTVVLGDVVEVYEDVIPEPVEIESISVLDNQRISIKV